jgi:pyridoxal biosynthesis lyase PdxS
MSLGELPLIVSLGWEQALELGPRVMQAGAIAVSLSAPRGTLPYPAASVPDAQATEPVKLVSGRLYGPGLFPQALDVVRNASRLGLPVIGAGGVYSMEQAGAMLAAGAMGVQVDSALWRGTWSRAQE